jgi:hypothetical protein
MAYDSARGVTVLFGGCFFDPVTHAFTQFSDTWEWDGTNWALRSPATSPLPRRWHAMAYDSARGVTVLFGGRYQPNPMIAIDDILSDTWEWDGSTWSQQTPATSPPARDMHAMAYDSANGEMVLFGGTLEDVFDYGDTWVYWGQGGACTANDQCDTGYCLNGVCSVAADGGMGGSASGSSSNGSTSSTSSTSSGMSSGGSAGTGGSLGSGGSAGSGGSLAAGGSSSSGLGGVSGTRPPPMQHAGCSCGVAGARDDCMPATAIVALGLALKLRHRASRNESKRARGAPAASSAV